MKPSKIGLSFIASVVSCALAVNSASGATPQERALAYFHAIDYLRAIGAGTWANDEGQSVLLGSGVAADPLVAGPRSTSHLSSLEFHSVDARGRRARALAPLGIETSADRLALLDVLALALPGPLSLNPAIRNDSNQHSFGRNATRAPSALDNAMAIQGVRASRAAAGESILSDPAVDDAIIHLLEVQLNDHSWPVARNGEVGGSGPAGDVGVSAEVVLALHPYEVAGWNVVPDPALGLTIDLPQQLADATFYLRNSAPTSAADRALRLLALLEREPSASTTETALDELVSMQRPQTDPVAPGSFESVAYPTALAALAILRASAHYPFDTDGDTINDDADDDIDGDGALNHADAFPFDDSEQRDSDGDGVGDEADTDADGDGVLDSQEPGWEANAQESSDADGDGIGDTMDPHDDADGLTDVEELLLGLDPTAEDTDGDSFRDDLEVASGTDGADSGEFPLPDGDIYPLGNPDGVVDVRDAVLALRVAAGQTTVSAGDQLFFDRHADVAPLNPGTGTPTVDGLFTTADAVVILRRATGAVPAW